MVAIAHHHILHVPNAPVLPRVVADELPAGQLLENEETDFIAALQKLRILRIMRCSNDIDPELVLQDLGVARLQSIGRRSPDERERLVAIEPSQLEGFAVDVEATIHFVEAE